MNEFQHLNHDFALGNDLVLQVVEQNPGIGHRNSSSLDSLAASSKGGSRGAVKAPLPFAAADIAAFERGDAVILDDNRRGYVVGRCFGFTPGGAPRLEYYSVMLVGGLGRVAAKPSAVRASQPIMRSAA